MVLTIGFCFDQNLFMLFMRPQFYYLIKVKSGCSLDYYLIRPVLKKHMYPNYHFQFIVYLFFQGVYGDMYHSGYGYASYAPYTSPGSPAPSLGHDGSYYGTQQYQFPGSFYQPQIPKKAYTKKSNNSTQGVSDTPTLSADVANPGSNNMNGNKNMMKSSYAKVASANGVASSSYQNQTRVGKKSPWSEGNIFSDKQNVPAVTSTGSTTGLNGNNKLQGSNQNHRPIPHYMVSLQIPLL